MRTNPRPSMAKGRASNRPDPPKAGRRTTLAIAFLAAVATVTLASRGWLERGASTLELTGPEALRRLPREVADLVPADSILRLDEASQEGTYRLWVLHRPGGARLDFQPRPRGLDQHQMPPSALEAILQRSLPSLERGRPLEPHCQFTHWRLADGAEIQIRELVTEQGWFASVERVAL